MPLYQVDFSFHAPEFEDDEDSWMEFKRTVYVIADAENDAKKVAIEEFRPYFHKVTGKVITHENWEVFLDHGVLIARPKYLTESVVCAKPWVLEKHWNYLPGRNK